MAAAGDDEGGLLKMPAVAPGGGYRYPGQEAAANLCKVVRGETGPAERLGLCPKCDGTGRLGLLSDEKGFGFLSRPCPACAMPLIALVDAGRAQPREGKWCKYEWIRKENTQPDRAERRDITQLTMQTVAAQSYKFGDRVVSLKFGADMLKDTKLISPSLVDPTKHCHWPKHCASTGPITPLPAWKRASILSVVEEVVSSVALKKRRDGETVVFVNAASAYQAGGGFRGGGRHALEESLCTQSSLFKSMERIEEIATACGVAAPSWATPQNTSFGKPWKMHIPDDGAALSPHVEFFRTVTTDGYAFEAEPLSVEGIVSIAMPNCNKKVRDAPVDAARDHIIDDLGPYDGVRDHEVEPEEDACYVEQIERKWRVAFVTAAFYTMAHVLVVPCAGCGVFANPPALVGTIAGRILRNEFAGRFSEIIIAAPPGGKNKEFADAVVKGYGETQ